MILRRATLLGHSDSHPVDVLIEAGRIAAIEYSGHIPSSDDHEEIDLDGRVVAPGFWDEHVHLGSWAEYRRSIDLRSANSPAEAAALMAAGESAVTDEIVVGVAYRDGLWEEPKTRAVLDSASTGRPWVLWSVDVHSCWLNSAALETLGLDLSNESGVLRELDAFGLAGRLSDVDPALRDSWVHEAVVEARSRGVVGVVDFDMADNLANWRRRREGVTDFDLRIEAGVYPKEFDAAIEQGHHTGDPVAPGVTVGPLKVITDGSLNTRTACCVEPYLAGSGDEYGAMNYDTDTLISLMEKAKAHGFTPAFHAIGDDANRIVLDVFERLEVTGRIEHAQLLRDDDFSRMAAQGIVASVQPQHAVDDREVADKYWADRTHRVIALRSMRDAGVELAFGSDAPVSPLHPMQQIAAAVTRTDDARNPWEPHQRISVAEAIQASTRTTIQVGQPADLIAFGADPLWLERAMAHDPSALYQALVSLPVELTVVDGRVQHNQLESGK